jgi:hypothetical protein
MQESAPQESERSVDRRNDLRFSSEIGGAEHFSWFLSPSRALVPSADEPLSGGLASGRLAVGRRRCSRSGSGSGWM